MSSKKLKFDLENKKKIISIFGLGNVGGPLAAAWLNSGATVIGVDISKRLLTEIKKGSSHKKEPFISEIFTKSLKLKKFIITDDGIEASKKSQIKIITVPVGLKKRHIDLKALISAATSISKGLKKGDAVIISPSIPPGTTSEIVLPILEKYSNLKGEKDFYLIYNPERIFEGRALEDIEKNYPAIISGLGKKSLDFADNLFKIISKKGTLKMSSISNAEAEKLFEGVYRDVNIALANELAGYCEKVGVNYWDARKGANSQPFCHLHSPGTGVGGLCIPVYPKFVIDSANKIGKSLKIIQNSRKINDQMPVKCVKDSIEFLRQNKIKISGAKIAILGLGFRGEVTDSRLSPTFTVMKEFLKMHCKISIHDPFIKKDPKIPKNILLSSNLKEVVNDSSLVFISSDHKMYSKLNKKSLSTAKPHVLIYDGRKILKSNKFSSNSLLTIGIR